LCVVPGTFCCFDRFAQVIGIFYGVSHTGVTFIGIFIFIWINFVLSTSIFRIHNRYSAYDLSIS
jgi:hypothetical protein